MNREDEPRRKRRLLLVVLRSLSVLAWLGSGFVAMPPTCDDDQVGPAPDGPPPGHPERLVAEPPMTPAERELWLYLDSISWW